MSNAEHSDVYETITFVCRMINSIIVGVFIILGIGVLITGGMEPAPVGGILVMALYAGPALLILAMLSVVQAFFTWKIEAVVVDNDARVKRNVRLSLVAGASLFVGYFGWWLTAVFWL